MRLLERYLFRQLLIAVAWITLALTGVAVLTSSLTALDMLVNQRQSALVFIEVTLLATPQIIALILPMAMFIAAMLALNRLHTEQEIVICYVGGMSPWRVASPAVSLASMVAIAILAINLWVQPLCFRELRAVVLAARGDLAASMITPGQFTHPAPGLTVYAQSIEQSGEIRNLFINEENARGQSSTIMASDARFAKRDGAPMLILRGGSYEQLSKTGDLNTLWFDEYPIDLRPFLRATGQGDLRDSDRYLHELLFPDPRDAWARAHAPQLLTEANARLSSPLYSLASTALALAAVLGGSFSRMGYGARIAVASGAAVGVRVLGFIAGALAAGAPWLNVLQYVAPVSCFVVCILIVVRQRPVLRSARGPARAAKPAAFGSPA